MVLFLLVSDWSITGWSVDNQSIIQLVNAEALSVGRSVGRSIRSIGSSVTQFTLLLSYLKFYVK